MNSTLRIIRQLALAGLLLLGPAVIHLYAQTTSATVSGFVTDQTGAAIPGAHLTLQNVATGSVRVATSNNAGQYIFELLPPGTYNMTAAKPGFTSVAVTNLIVAANANVGHDFRMAVGKVTQRVTVQASPVQVNSQTASLGTIIGATETAELPLNERDFLQLSELSAGVAPPPTQNGQSTAQGLLGGDRQTEVVDISGTREGSEIVMFDGIPEKQFFFGLATLQPPPDSIAEFNIQEGYFSPQLLGPAVINVVTKSGTNTVHGAAWEFLRNNSLNARNFFETTPGPYKMNQFGFTAGGPAIKSKLFWFGDYQGLRIITSAPGYGLVPTAAEMSGDFAGVLPTLNNPATYNPTTGTYQPFPGNIIPASSIVPFAKAYEQYIPHPNSAPIASEGESNYVATVFNDQFDNEYDLRGDLDWSAKNRFFGRVSRMNSQVFKGGLFPAGSVVSPLVGVNAVFGWTHIFGPNVVNEFRAGLDRSFLNSSTPADASGPDYATQLGFTNLGGIAVCNGVPQVSIAGYSSFGEGNGNCEVNGNTDKDFIDTLEILHGRHDISLGFDIVRVNWKLIDSYQLAGYFSFTGQFTGNGVADYLLGDVDSVVGADGAGEPPTYRTAFWPHVFLNDNFHATRKLTLNMGLGWQYTPAPTEKYDDLWGFNFNAQNPDMIRCGTEGVPPGCLKHNWTDFAPRFGFAYSPASNWAIRSSYGVFWDRLPGNEWVWNSTDWPFQSSYSATSDVFVPTINLGQPADIFPPPSTGIPAATLPAVGTAIFNLGPYNRDDPYIQQWTFSVQHTLPGHILTQLAYVGSKGTHLSKRLDSNVDPEPGPGPVQARRPYPEFGFILNDQGRANSEYEALQAQATKPMGHGLTFVSGFTWSKSLDDDSYDGKASRNYNPYSMDKGPSIFDLEFRFTLGAVYALPFGNNLTGVKKEIAGGWQLSPIISEQTGLPFEVTTTTDPSNTGVEVGETRPNRICNGNLPASQQTPQRWFNTACFTEPALYTYGNGGIGYLRTDGFNEVDIALEKNFPITERAHLQFRAEFFNLFNAVNFTEPNNSLGGVNFGEVFGAESPRLIQFALKLLF